MLEYEWGGNPSTIILSAPGDDPPSHEDNQTDPNRHFFHPSTAHNDSFNGPQDNHLVLHNPQPPSALYHQQHIHQVNPFFDPRAYTTTPTSFLSLDHHNHLAHSSSNFFLIPKAEEPTTEHFTSRIGLNLGGRTYFSSAEDDFVNRLYRRSRPLIDPSGSTSSSVINVPRCQADGCNADLTHAKHYHRRHKVCEFHSKASTVIAHGLTQRFCQQCSRFHLLSDFDNGKRSCRKRLADHNRRRRKSNQTNQEISRRSPQPASARNSPSDNLTRSPPDSGAHSSSSVTAALSPPRMSLDCFKHRPYQPPTTTSLTTGSSSSASSSSLFFPSG